MKDSYFATGVGAVLLSLLFLFGNCGDEDDEDDDDDFSEPCEDAIGCETIPE